ncbi:MAG TPA: sensor histidine kinase, partial [Sedimenticola thiotaurini]|nr:sensor histidine kinase [Sedimenticola thiotaurini]
MRSLNRRHGVWLLVFAAFCLLLWTGARWARQVALAELQQQARLDLERYVAHLQGQLEKYEFLPVVLASNRRLVSLLQHPEDPKRIEALNRYLETINRITGTSDTYLMDREGLTIAASNWQSERPFVGRNFSYRPYFKEAMKGNLGRYFALGTTSNKRGYYFAYPVRHQGRILGAVVIKLDLAATERNWSRPGTEFIVTDPDGVVFITTHRGWRFKTLTPLTPEVYRRIRESRRYVDAPIEPLPIDSSEELSGGVRLLRIGTDPPGEFLVQEMAMPQAGWKVQVLSRTDAIARQQIRTLAFLAILFIALLLLALFWNQRRKRLRERVRFERQAKRMLETRVQEQTRELQKAQDALIQSAKLAVIGQLSTGISHELNQPLAAIRTYADNARALLQRGRQEAASENLSHISELTERMARISSQLKIFARRTSGETTPVPLSAAIDDSLDLLAARLR